jgi:adenylylsulfate kinase
MPRRKQRRKKEAKPSLFIGRWQPFHQGHKKLIESVLKKGKPVVIAIRNTPISSKDPYTKYGALVKIVVIPDIDEICYGRNVGYGVRRVDLGKKIEKISGTRTRASFNKVIWLTGNTGSGKTTLAYLLRERLNAVVLDGNEMRDSISRGAGFSKKDREEHNLRVARLAKVLYRQRHNVIIAVIAPYASTRRKIGKIIKPTWIYVKREMPHDPKKPYEPPKRPALIVDTDKYSIMDCVNQIWEKII